MMRLTLGAAILTVFAAFASHAGAIDFQEVRFRVGGRLDGRFVEDVDGDGDLDLMVLEGRRLVLYRQGEKGFPPWPSQVLPISGKAMVIDLGDRVGSPGKELITLTEKGAFYHPWTGKGWGRKALVWVDRPTALRQGGGIPLLRDVCTDLDGDGRCDLLFPAPSAYVLFHQDEKGNLVERASMQVQPKVTLRVPRARRLGNLTAQVRYPVPFLGDFDADGLTDVVVRRDEMLHVFLGRKDGKYSSVPDLKLDTGLKAEKKEMSGRLRLSFDAPMLVTDLTGEGALDLVACLPMRGEALVVERRGGREAGKPSFVFRMDGWPLASMVRDLDGRNGPDLIVGGIDKVGIWSVLKIFLTKEVVVHSFFFLNRGGGKYPKKPDRQWDVNVPLRFATTSKGFRMGTTVALNFEGDFNGDRRRDLVMRRGNVQLDLFLGTDDGVFEAEPFQSLTIHNAEPYRYVFPETFDFNGDGVSDILLHYRDWSEKRDALILHLSKK